MMNNLMIFENEEFGNVRTVCINGEPWLVGKDVAEILRYTNPLKAIRDHVDDEDKGVNETVTPGGKQMLIVINESGFYSLVLKSKMPDAKRFRHWITSEVLPTIPRTGGYVSNEDMFVESYLPFADEPIKQLFRLQCRVINQLNDRIRHDQPLVEFANQVGDTSNCIDVGTMGKLAFGENSNFGRTRMFRWLRAKKLLTYRNIPYQKYIDAGCFVVKESVYERVGVTRTYQQTLVTCKGQQYLIKRLREDFVEVDI